MASKALSNGLFTLRNNNKEIWFNMPGNKRKLMNYPTRRRSSVCIDRIL
jgi:hypothetical protein